MKYLLLIILLPIGVLAQNDLSIRDYRNIPDSAKSNLGLWFETSYNSNVLNNSFYFNYVFGTGVTRTSMNTMKNRALNKNIVGLQQIDRLYYSWRGNESVVHNVNLGSRRLAYGTFNEDAFLLLGFGNKEFAGSTADLSNVRARVIGYTQIQYNFSKQLDSGITYGVGAAFLMGNEYTDFSLGDAHIYTSPIGDSLYLAAQGQVLRGDTSKNNIYSIMGVGASVDGFVSFPVNLFKKNEEKGRLTIEINDLGLISWNNTVEYKVNGDVSWAGIETPSIFDFTDSIYQDQIPTDLDEELVESVEKKQIVTHTNPRIAIYHTEKVHDRLEVRTMLDYRFNSSYLPYLASTQTFSISEAAKPYQWKLNTYQSVGGYGFFGFGLGGQVVHKRFSSVLGVRHLIATTVPEILNGFNAHFGFRWNLY